jgi:hypothetical protein
MGWWVIRKHCSHDSRENRCGFFVVAGSNDVGQAVSWKRALHQHRSGSVFEDADDSVPTKCGENGASVPLITGRFHDLEHDRFASPLSERDR